MSSFGVQPKCLCPSGYKGLHCEGCILSRFPVYFSVFHSLYGQIRFTLKHSDFTFTKSLL